MESLRRRAPFKAAEGELPEEDGRILDEQEQEALIQTLKEANTVSNTRSLNALQVILVLSFGLQVISLFQNPILSIIPLATPDPTPEIPLPIPFTVFNIGLHLNLALIAFRGELRSRNITSDTSGPRPLPYQLLYAIAAVPPTLSMFLRKAWQSSAWWGETLLIVFTVQTVLYSIGEGNESISELESLRYTSRGA